MPSISKKNGRFHVRVRRKGHPTKCQSFQLKSDARKWAYDLERSIDTGQFFDADITLYSFLERYKKEITVKKRSIEQETYRISALQRHRIALINVKDVTGFHLSLFRDERLKTVSGSAVIKDINLLSHVFNVAQREWGYEQLENPVSKLNKPKPNEPRKRRLVENEFNRLLKAAIQSENFRFPVLIEFAIETGMRRGELLSLQWSDVHIDQSFCHLPITKNGSIRDVPLSGRAKTLLSDLPRDNELVFPIHFEALKGLWKRAIKRAGIDDLHFHYLRHEATSRFFEKDLNVMEVATFTGHKDLTMLQRYTHLRASDIATKLLK